MPNERYTTMMSDITAKRSKFNMPFDHQGTINAGDLKVVYFKDCIPGDTIHMKNMSSVVRSLTPLFPVMDNAYLDIHFFYVPNRLVWNHYKQFCGENDVSAWVDSNEYEIPMISVAGDNGDTSIFDDDYTYLDCVGSGFGLPIGQIGKIIVDAGSTDSENIPHVSSLPLRAYINIWNEWYRDQNVCSPILFSKDDTDVFTDDNTFFEEYHYIAPCLKVARYKDAFTSAVPAPQKGESVLYLDEFLPVAPFVRGKIGDSYLGNVEDEEIEGLGFITHGRSGVDFKIKNWDAAPYDSKLLALDNSGDLTEVDLIDTASEAVEIETNYGDVAPYNLSAYTGASALHTISQLRMAFQLQRLYECRAMFGSRYREQISALYHVQTRDATIQIPEYIGGKHIMLNMQQVVNTADSSTAPLGTVGGLSNTGFKETDVFTYSADEPGMLIGLACIRTENRYCQGVLPYWTRKKFTDFYNPFFAHISYQPIYKQEICIDTEEKNKEVFGYQEAWWDYREMPNICSGFMDVAAGQSLSQWTYARKFAIAPSLSQQFIEQSTEEVDRTLAVTSRLTSQFFFDINFNATYTRVMPVFSVPGLIDHVL